MKAKHIRIATDVELNLFERLLTLFTRVRPGEGIAVATMFCHGFLVLGCYYLLRPLREALILSEGSAEMRSYAAAFQAGVLLLIVPLYSWLYHQRGDSLMIQRINIFFILNLVLFAVLGILGLRFGFLFFIWVGIFNVMVIAQFWAFAADLFNVKAGQRLFAIIAVGSSLGAIGGARISGLLIEPFGPYGVMLLASAVLACTVIVSSFAQRVVPDESRALPEAGEQGAPQSWLGGFQVVFQSHYLLAIATLVVLLNWVMSNGDYILNQFVESAVLEALGSNASSDQQARWMGQFFSTFYSWVNLGVFIVQLFFVSRIFLWVGVHVAILMLPLLMAGGFLLIGLLPAFALVQLVLGTQKAVDYSLMNTTRNALFLPTSRAEKYEGKTAIDTFFMRFGDMFSALAIFAVATLGFSRTGFIGLNVLLAVLLFVLAWYIGRHYRGEASSDSFNRPPQAYRIIPDADWVGDGPFHHVIPQDAFVDSDAGDVLNVELTGLQDDLPGWLRYDRRSQILHCERPPGHAAEIRILAVARDYDGMEASSVFVIRRRIE